MFYLLKFIFVILKRVVRGDGKMAHTECENTMMKILSSRAEASQIRVGG